MTEQSDGPGEVLTNNGYSLCSNIPATQKRMAMLLTRPSLTAQYCKIVDHIMTSILAVQVHLSGLSASTRGPQYEGW